MPLFFFSDPPHLIKKLRNNIHTSGFKENHPQYTQRRTIHSMGSKYAVYKRKKRHLYVTDLRKSHVEIDSFSKMRVKLVVQTLYEEMEASERQVTEQTCHYIRNCGTFWNVFNYPKPLKNLDDIRIVAELDN